MRIKVDNISFHYKKDTPVFRHLSFGIEPGKVVFLLGHNGVGKTTLFKCMLGILHPQEGEVLVDGTPVRSLSSMEVARKISYIPQAHFPTFNHLVIDVVVMGAMNRLNIYQTPGPEEETRAMEALQLLGIEHLAYKGYGEISGGERQLVLIARAVVQGSDTFLMDEPCSSLDYGNQLLILQHCVNLAASGKSILISSHNPEHTLWFSDHVIVMHDHEILCNGPTGEILTAEVLSTIYRIPIQITEAGEGDHRRSVCLPL